MNNQRLNARRLGALHRLQNPSPEAQKDYKGKAEEIAILQQRTNSIMVSDEGRTKKKRAS